MKVALVSSEGRCGIAEHSNMLVAAVQDLGIDFRRDARWLDPEKFDRWDCDILHLNYHRGLHSQWTPEWLHDNLRPGPKVVITFHDTYETQPDNLPWALLDVCDAMIVHEPCDLQTGTAIPLVAATTSPDVLEIYAASRPRAAKVHYWRQGVPDPVHAPYPLGEAALRPYVGTCGFAFPWKGFELLCDAAQQVGWGVLILSHNATDAQVKDWQARNPWVKVVRQYMPTERMVAMLAGCDATAFLYSCANSGTSGAIRLGIAAGKPLLATYGCRQFRDLQEMQEATGIYFIDPDVPSVAKLLQNVQLLRFDPDIVALRERDSWRHLGAKYAALYRSLVQEITP